MLYAEVDERLAMTVADTVSVHEITTKDLSEEASSWGMPPRRAQQRIGGLLDRMAGAIAAPGEQIPHSAAIATIVGERLERLRKATA